MTHEEVKEWMNRGRYADKTITALKCAREEALVRVVNTTTTLQDVKTAQPSFSRHDESLIRYADKDYDGLLLEWISKLNKVLHEISWVVYAVQNSQYQLLLVYRYILFKTWEQIAVDMSISYQWVHVLHGRALAAVENILT